MCRLGAGLVFELNATSLFLTSSAGRYGLSHQAGRGGGKKRGTHLTVGTQMRRFRTRGLLLHRVVIAVCMRTKARYNAPSVNEHSVRCGNRKTWRDAASGVRLRDIATTPFFSSFQMRFAPEYPRQRIMGNVGRGGGEEEEKPSGQVKLRAIRRLKENHTTTRNVMNDVALA